MIEDPKLKHLVDLMSEIIVIQSLCKAIKQAGLTVPSLDKYLFDMDRASRIVLREVNRRIIELTEEV